MISEMIDQFLDRISPYSARLILWWFVLTASLWVHNTLSSVPLLATDYGHWIMFSRYYLGQPTPAYLDPRSVHPIVPVILALLTIITNNGIEAIRLLATILYSLLLLATYIAHKSLFHSQFAAILAVILIGLGQNVLVYMTLGLLPQLGAIVGINVTIIALTTMAKSPYRWSSWLLLSSACTLVLFIHVPTGPLYLLSTLISIGLLTRHLHLSAKRMFSRILVGVGLPVIGWLLFCFSFSSVVKEYLTNEAGFYRFEVLHFFSQIATNQSFAIVLMLGILSIIILEVWISLDPTKNSLSYSVSLLSIWLVTPAIFMILSYLIGLGTDYDRFIYYFVVSPVFALAYVVSVIRNHFSRIGTGTPGLGARKHYRWNINVFACIGIVVLLLVLSNGVRLTIDYFVTSVSRFSLPYPSAFLDLIPRIDVTRPSGSILVPSRPEAAWVEGLTGQQTLFPEAFPYIYRTDIIDRSLAAEMINAGTDATVDNGYLLVMSTHQEPILSTPDPSIAVFHHGEYTQLVTFHDEKILLEIEERGTRRLLNLARDFHRTTTIELDKNHQHAYIRNRYTPKLPISLYLEKRIDIPSDEPNLTISFHSRHDNGIQVIGLEILIQDLSDNGEGIVVRESGHPLILSATSESVTLQRQTQDNSTIKGRITSTPATPQVTTTAYVESTRGVVLKLGFESDNELDLSVYFSIEFDTRESLHTGLRTYNLPKLTEIYDITSMMIYQTNYRAQDLLEYYGLVPTYANWNYIIYDTRRIPSWVPLSLLLRREHSVQNLGMVHSCSESSLHFCLPDRA